jgi:HPt (histidine-containing phosphotransfer) domain-containing protein
MDDYIRKPMRREDLVRVIAATRPRPPAVESTAAIESADRDAPALDDGLFAAFVVGVGEQDPAEEAAFIAAYAAGMGAELRQLREALAYGADLGRTAHTLKGLSLQLGALELAALCRRIEAASKGEGAEDVGALLGAAEGAFAALQRALARRGPDTSLVETI